MPLPGDPATTSQWKLTQILQALLKVMAAGEDPCASASDLVVWSDEENTYLECCLPDMSRVSLDLCLHDGRAFVRMERSREADPDAVPTAPQLAPDLTPNTPSVGDPGPVASI